MPFPGTVLPAPVTDLCGTRIEPEEEPGCHEAKLSHQLGNGGRWMDDEDGGGGYEMWYDSSTGASILPSSEGISTVCRENSDI